VTNPTPENDAEPPVGWRNWSVERVRAWADANRAPAACCAQREACVADHDGDYGSSGHAGPCCACEPINPPADGGGA